MQRAFVSPGNHLLVQITADERLLAERYYLKRYASRWAGSRGNDEPEMTFAAEHPRYNHLVASERRALLHSVVRMCVSLCAHMYLTCVCIHMVMVFI